MNLAFVEGWALYCEEMMARYGLYEELSDPGLRYLGGVRFRAARVVVDKRLHCGEYSYDDAVEFMVEQFGEDSREFIRSEVRRYCAYPTQAMSYLIGKLALMDLRERLEAEWGDGFTMMRFHNALMKEGSIPTALLADKLLGREIRLENF
jgi:uncharacterized protein (DUF885 family)